MRKGIFTKLHWIVLVLVAGLALMSGHAHGVGALQVDPSIRGSGMGKATMALFWGPDPSHWRNPALVSYQRGIRYESGETQLVPDLADDVHLTTQSLTLGAWGLGLAFEGQPLGEWCRALEAKADVS